MKQFIVLFALVALTMGAPAEEVPSKRSLPAVEHKDERDDTGYNIRYVTAEGTIVSEHARLVPTADGSDKVIVSEGEVSYVGPDGKTYVTKWSAGLDGMKFEGAHLPVVPEPVPVPVVAEAIPAVVAAPVAAEAAPVVAEAAPVVAAEATPVAAEDAPAIVTAPAISPIPAAPVLPQAEVLVLAY